MFLHQSNADHSTQSLLSAIDLRCIPGRHLAVPSPLPSLWRRSGGVQTVSRAPGTVSGQPGQTGRRAGLYRPRPDCRAPPPPPPPAEARCVARAAAPSSSRDAGSRRDCEARLAAGLASDSLREAVSCVRLCCRSVWRCCDQVGEIT